MLDGSSAISDTGGAADADAGDLLGAGTGESIGAEGAQGFEHDLHEVSGEAAREEVCDGPGAG